MERRFVDATSPSDLEPIIAGLRHAARAAGRRESVLPRRPELEESAAVGSGNAKMATELLPQEADVFLSLPEYRGRRWLRAVLLNRFTGGDTIDRTFAAVDAFYEQRGAR